MILDRMSILASYGRKKIAGDMAASIGGVVPDTTAAVSDEMMMKLDRMSSFSSCIAMRRRSWHGSEIGLLSEI